ncbi:RNA degradosome polyphosphate kinase, partial [bacterium]|nr:RNA degradosome polyphosphate kinase [bacterium]
MADSSRQYLNRELSWLEFNGRVLEEARDPANRLLERVKFLGITGSNLDEFFMVRVGGLQHLLEEGQNRFDPAGLTTTRQLAEISRRTHQLVAEQYACLLEDLEPQLAAAGLRRLGVDQLDPRQQQHIEQVFTHEVFPVITPIACRSAGRFPLLPGLGVNLLVRLAPARRRARKARFAVIAIPRRVNRLVSLPAETGYAYVLLEEIVRAFVDRLFPGESVAECVPFRITRNADLSVREDLAGDLLRRMRQVLDARKRSAGVRLEIGATVSETCLGYLRDTLGVRADAIYRIPGPLGLSAFRDLPRVPGFDQLKDEP